GVVQVLLDPEREIRDPSERRAKVVRGHVCEAIELLVGRRQIPRQLLELASLLLDRRLRLTHVVQVGIGADPALDVPVRSELRLGTAEVPAERAGGLGEET